MLSKEKFKIVVENTPLFAIDLVVMNEEQKILVGLRLNRPAKDFWFVPGGRVFKNETLRNAFTRISKNELGCEQSIDQAQLIGLYEHFYSDSAASKKLSTHYINAAHLIKVKASSLELPFGGQHQNYKWLESDELEEDDSVHKFSKVFLGDLKLKLLVQ